MNQEGLGFSIGTSTQSVSAYENGREKIPAFRIVQIARVLGCRYEDLLPEIDCVDEKKPVDTRELEALFGELAGSIVEMLDQNGLKIVRKN